MDYTKLGRSNLTVSKICLGTMHFGPYASEEESHKILDRTLELGINFIDTANVYGGDDKGRSEKIIGSWFARRPEVRDQVVLATKLYNPMQKGNVPNDEAGFSAYKARKQVKDSLERLQTDRIDLYQVHHIDRRVSPEEFWGTYEKMIADGDVLYAGSSNFPGWGLAKMQMQAWATRLRRLCVRADAVQPAQPHSRVGSAPCCARLGHRRHRLHAAGRRPLDREDERG